MATPKIRDIQVIETAPVGLRLTGGGREVDRIGDIWHAGMPGSYWRNDPVLNNALSGVNLALREIKGRMEGGGGLLCSFGRGRDCGRRGFSASGRRWGAGGGTGGDGEVHDGQMFKPAVHARRSLQMFEACQERLGKEIEC